MFGEVLERFAGMGLLAVAFGLLTGCASASGAITVHRLQPTIDGHELVPADIEPSTLETAPSSIRLSGMWRRTSTFHFLADKVVCAFGPGPGGGVTIQASAWSSADEVGRALMSLDLTHAEEQALERGTSLSTGAVWLVTADEQAAHRAATALLEAELVRSVHLGILANPGRRDGVQLLILPPGAPTHVTDNMPSRTAGLLVADGEQLLRLLHGPSTRHHYVADGVDVVVRHHGERGSWVYPSEDNTEQDLLWTSALHALTGQAIAHCIGGDADRRRRRGP